MDFLVIWYCNDSFNLSDYGLRTGYLNLFGFDIKFIFFKILLALIVCKGKFHRHDHCIHIIHDYEYVFHRGLVHNSEVEFLKSIKIFISNWQVISSVMHVLKINMIDKFLQIVPHDILSFAFYGNINCFRLDSDGHKRRRGA